MCIFFLLFDATGIVIIQREQKYDVSWNKQFLTHFHLLLSQSKACSTLCFSYEQLCVLVGHFNSFPSYRRSIQKKPSSRMAELTEEEVNLLYYRETLVTDSEVIVQADTLWK